MKKFGEKEVKQFLKDIKAGKSGVVICITEKTIADYGNSIDAESLLIVLDEFSMIIRDQLIIESNSLEGLEA